MLLLNGYTSTKLVIQRLTVWFVVGIIKLHYDFRNTSDPGGCSMQASRRPCPSARFRASAL